MKFRAGHKSGYTQLIQHSGTMPISSHFFRCILSLWILSRARGYVRKVSSFCLKSGFLSDFEGFWVSGLLFLIIEGLCRILSSPFTVACVAGAKRGGGRGGGKARKRGKGKGEPDGFHIDVIKLYSQNGKVLRILIYTRLKINKK